MRINAKYERHLKLIKNAKQLLCLVVVLKKMFLQEIDIK
jgi:hypothetical protein